MRHSVEHVEDIGLGDIGPWGHWTLGHWTLGILNLGDIGTWGYWNLGILDLGDRGPTPYRMVALPMILGDLNHPKPPPLCAFLTHFISQ